MVRNLKEFIDSAKEKGLTLKIAPICKEITPYWIGLRGTALSSDGTAVGSYESMLGPMTITADLYGAKGIAKMYCKFTEMYAKSIGVDAQVLNVCVEGSYSSNPKQGYKEYDRNFLDGLKKKKQPAKV
jgi:hypothetical protein